MLCPHCGAEMRLMALIEDEPVIDKDPQIFAFLGSVKSYSSGRRDE